MRSCLFITIYRLVIYCNYSNTHLHHTNIITILVYFKSTTTIFLSVVMQFFDRHLWYVTSGRCIFNNRDLHLVAYYMDSVISNIFEELKWQVSSCCNNIRCEFALQTHCLTVMFNLQLSIIYVLAFCKCQILIS